MPPGVMLLVVFVLVLRKVGSNSANHGACDRPEHPAAYFVGDEPTTGTTDQRCAQTTLAFLARSVKAGALGLSWSSTIVTIARLLAVGRLLLLLAIRRLLLLLAVRGLLGILNLGIGTRAAVAWLLWVGVRRTILLLRGSIVTLLLLRRTATIVWLWWVSILVVPLSVIRLRRVIILLRRAPVLGLLLPAAVIVSAGHACSWTRMG
jgi:hypothetical protein